MAAWLAGAARYRWRPTARRLRDRDQRRGTRPRGSRGLDARGSLRRRHRQYLGAFDAAAERDAAPLRVRPDAYTSAAAPHADAAAGFLRQELLEARSQLEEVPKRQGAGHGGGGRAAPHRQPGEASA